MTRIDELKSAIVDKQKRMKELNTLSETNKRVKTDTERTEFDTLKADVRNLEKEYEDAETVARIKYEAPIIITSEQKAKNRIYNSSKAINEFREGRTLTGIEGEIQAIAKANNSRIKGLFIPDKVLYERTSFEAVKRTAGITYANSEGLIPETVTGLDIVAVPSLYETLGVTVLDGLTSVHKLNYGQGVTADSVAEGASLSGKTRTKTSDNLEPKRYGHSEIISIENLAVTSIINDVIRDGDRACKAKISMALLDAIVANTGCTLSGYAVSDSGKTMTEKILAALKASVLSGTFSKPAFIMGSTMYSELQATVSTSILKAIIENGKLLGFDVFDAMTLMGVHDTTMYDIIFGDMKRASVGFWGLSGLDLQLLINPFEGDDEGEVKFLFNRIADVSFNPYAYKVIRNAELA